VSSKHLVNQVLRLENPNVPTRTPGSVIYA
jgi:hypothetical protein